MESNDQKKLLEGLEELQTFLKIMARHIETRMVNCICREDKPCKYCLEAKRILAQIK